MAGDDGAPPLPPQKIEINNPFYLGAHDRSGDFIIPIRLKLDNFDSWSHAIKVALCSCRKFDFLDGTITDVVSLATKEDWVVVHCMLVSWLMNTIDPEVKSMLSNYDNAKQLWDDLHKRFCVVNGPRIHQLKSQINKCEQTKTMSVAIYFGKLKVLWDELAQLQPLISCKCGKCTCDVSKQHVKHREDDMLQQFLLGLYSEYYTQIRSNILAQDPLPSLNKAYQQVSQEELVRGFARVQDEPSLPVGFVVHATVLSLPRTSLFVLIARSQIIWLQTVMLYKCVLIAKSEDMILLATLKLLVTLKDGPRGIEDASHLVKAVGWHVQMQQPSAAHLQHTRRQTPSPPLFLRLQVDKFSRQHSGKLSWVSLIIDTGATHHVIGEKSWLFVIKNIHCPMGLPNGDTVVANMEGSVYLSATITLHHVLYDQMKALIGTGVRRDGLYYFSKSEVVSVVEATSDVELWHKRMGHPSEKVVKSLPHVSRSRSSLNKNCEVCFRSKHHRDKFPLRLYGFIY
ncbi:uncharacterized protein LOC130826613 [Amaranthus tricolor]|uniref:uncharacterized protein LOC130826613 n=1 Tax=Amaranthus tricolor TaxID=29722 RepID=UPI00258D71C3|nr:uncharacterized protein LOC130826613 [Amaranthus tricolor]